MPVNIMLDVTGTALQKFTYHESINLLVILQSKNE